MEIILLEKVDNVGGIGDRVRVKSGYARNYLIPHGKATLATAANIAKFESRRAELEAKAAAELAAAQARAKKLEGLVLKIEMQAGAEGKLFGSVGTVDIAEEIGKRGISIERSEIRLAGRPAAPHRRASGRIALAHRRQRRHHGRHRGRRSR